MSRGPSFVLLVWTRFAVAFVSLASSSVLAAEDVEALIQRGVELRKKGQDDAAKVEFERAYRISKMPRVAAQLGFAEQATGNWAAAESHVQEALAAVNDPWVDKYRPTIEGALRVIQQHTGRIDILGGIPDAEVEVNGRIVGKLPLQESVLVNAGTVNIVLRAALHRASVRTVNVEVGERKQVHFVLESSESPGQKNSALTADSVLTPPPSPTIDRGRTLRLVGVGVGVTGIAFLLGGGACTVISNQKLDRIEADIAARPQRPYDESNGNWRSFQTASIALYIAGGVGLFGGATAYYFGRTRAGDEKTIARSFFTAPSRNGFIVGGEF